ncbi:MAG: hypothetical protein G01um101470_234 [Parcubacteria group bacterium Gr01-1014_70]|nr:MAG: hypothetical protein G01um101470_234 [Parcubacteria group bacterium Gr01-1014_70]
MAEKKSLQHVLIGGALVNLLLLTAGIYFYAYFIKPASTALNKSHSELALLEKRVTSFGSSERELDRRSADLTKLDAAFLNLDDAVSFVTQLESIARESGVTILLKAASLDAAVTKRSEFDILITGNIAGMLHFVEQVELLPYFTDISSLTISSKTGQIQASMKLSVLTL